MKRDWGAREDVALEAVAAKEELAVTEAPSARDLTPAQWVKENLFSTPFNSVLSVVAGLLAGWLLYAVLRWAFGTADWTVVKTNFRLYMIGRFPIEEAWRIWMGLYYVVLLVGLTWGQAGRRLTWDAMHIVRRSVLAILGVLLLLYLVDSPLVWSLMGGLVAAYLAGVGVGRIGRGRTMRRIVWAGWLLAFPFVIVVLQIADGVGPLRWNGFLLNVLAGVVGIVLSFPIGIVLALGRRSSLRAVRTVCVALIEVVRGAPLFAWLLFGVFLLPFLLPPGVQLPQIIRVMIMFTVFSSAYVAEIVRGGLQGVHFGQYEAARAVGLSTTRMMALVILPQALRNTIPAMISHFISLFKDTSLLAVIGFIDMLRAARIASASVKFIGSSRQTLLFAALIFWIVAFSMSRWSQRLERRLGVGER